LLVMFGFSNKNTHVVCLWVQKLSTFHSKPFQNLNWWNILWMTPIGVMKYCIQAFWVSATDSDWWWNC
jgi:hypothetical protein